MVQIGTVANTKQNMLLPTSVLAEITNKGLLKMNSSKENQSIRIKSLEKQSLAWLIYQHANIELQGVNPKSLD
ncbi:MAG: hypothetical protein AB8B37_08550 [Prochlorococcus sp.]